MYRQGDVLLVPVKVDLSEATPIERDKKNRVVLALGETTGHAHVFKTANVLFYMLAAKRYIEVQEQAAEFRHETENGSATLDHSSIMVPPGTYEVKGQEEYISKDWRRVAD